MIPSCLSHPLARRVLNELGRVLAAERTKALELPPLWHAVRELASKPPFRK
jgi:hypothetical protein